jgi:hypothetical protein
MILSLLKRRGPNKRRQLGQGLILFALMFLFLIGIIGLATDSAVAYAYNVSLERAAAAAALSGVPYMAPPPAPVGATATTKACEEARRNGYVDNSLCGYPNPNATMTVARNGANDMIVKLTTTVPTFFMAALGLAPFPTSREADAGYLPPISLGQPGPQLGSTVSQIGNANSFYIQRFKGYNKWRSEGDAYTPSSFEGAPAAPATDVHFISNQLGNETGALNNSAEAPCSAGGNGQFKMPCEGGQNYRITIPAGATGEIQVYNAANAPDFKAHATYKPNQCENNSGLTACSSSPSYTMKEGQDDGMSGSDPAAGTGPANPADLSQAHCGIVLYNIDCNATVNGTNGSPSNPAKTAQNLYNTVGYTVLAVPDIFLRSNDVPLTQTKVFPIDATNYDGNQAQTGGGQSLTPTYVNVMDKVPSGANNGKYGTEIQQTYGVAAYDVGGAATNPLNMRIYHSWTNIVREDGTGDTCTGAPSATCGGTRAASQVQNSNSVSCPTGGTMSAYSCYVGANSSLGPGTYRLRVDSLNADGTIGTKGDASKAYAVRVVAPGTPPNKDPNTDATVKCTAGGVDCTVAAWEDMCVYTPIAAGGGTIPLFQLSPDYRGAIIQVEVYDTGDASGLVDLAIIDPVTGLPAKLNTGGVGDYSPSVGHLQIFNQGNSRFGVPAQHKAPQAPDGGAPVGPTYEILPHVYLTNSEAGLESTAASGTPHYNGTWIRFEIPIVQNFNNSGFWSLQYAGTGANDTFTFAVRAKGGPVHLLRS